MSSDRVRRLSLVAVLSVLTAAACFPLIATGTDTDADQGAAAKARADDARTGELADRRTRTSRTYATTDGARVTRLYTGSVNYRSGGEWRPIDNTLLASGDPGYAFENRANRYEAQFPADISGKPVRVESGDKWIEFGLEDADGDGTNSRREVSYDDAFPGVDISYIADADSVKEALSLADASTRALPVLA
jgi:hypothetical protein